MVLALPAGYGNRPELQLIEPSSNDDQAPSEACFWRRLSIEMVIKVKVIPRSAKNSLEETADGSYVARVTAPPIEGAANEAVIKLLAEHFDAAKSRIKLLSGAKSRMKRFELCE